MKRLLIFQLVWLAGCAAFSTTKQPLESVKEAYDFEYQLGPGAGEHGLLQVFDDGEQTWFQFDSTQQSTILMFARDDGLMRPAPARVSGNYQVATGTADAWTLMLDGEPIRVHHAAAGATLPAREPRRAVSATDRGSHENKAPAPIASPADPGTLNALIAEIEALSEKIKQRNAKIKNLQERGPARIKPASPVEEWQVSLPFAIGSVKLSNSADTALQNLLGIAKSAQRITIQGISSQSGNRKMNLHLAKQRAQAVRDALLASGISESLISIQSANVQGSHPHALVTIYIPSLGAGGKRT